MKRIAKTISGLAMIMSVLALNTSCIEARRIKASGNYITKNIAVPDFNSIKVQGSEDVLFSQSTDGKTSVKVYASDNIVDLLDIRVDDETLIVKHKNNFSIFSFGNNGNVKVIVSSPNIYGASVQGSGDILFKTIIKTDKLDLYVQGSGDINGTGIICNELRSTVQGSGDIAIKGIKCQNIEAGIQGSGDILYEGEANSVTLKTQGSGDINAANLKGMNVYATTQGSGSISCFAIHDLKAKIQGSGDVSYRGNPRVDFENNNKLHKMD
jgi:hypothetical protein